jgi:hexokinase
VKPFLLTDADYSKLMDVMLDNFNRGLGKDTNATAAVKMFPTYVKAVPDGLHRQDKVLFVIKLF